MIDSMLFRYVMPAGTYTAGEEYELSLIDGPSVVRAGYGTAVLKKIFTVSDNGGPNGAYVTVKNQNWVDSLSNIVASVNGTAAFVALSQDGPCVQMGGDMELQPNSAFTVKVVIPFTATTTADTDIFCQIDIDYPEIAAVSNPEDEKGAPISIVRNDSIDVLAFATTGNWTTYAVDEFKAGYRYLLAKVGAISQTTSNAANIAFIKLHGTAAQNGLAQIIPVSPRYTGTNRFHLDYSVPMVKGPMLISYLVFGAAALTDSLIVEFDYIRR